MPGTARTRPGSARVWAPAAKGRRAARCARFSSAQLPSLRKDRAQMGRSCALTGLNWKRCEIPPLPTTSHHVDCATRGPYFPSSPAPPRAALAGSTAGALVTRAPSSTQAPIGERWPGSLPRLHSRPLHLVFVWPVLRSTRIVNFLLSLVLILLFAAPLGCIFFSFVLSASTLFVLSLLLHLSASFDAPLAFCFRSQFVYFLSVLPSLPTAIYLWLSTFLRGLFNFPFPLFGCLLSGFIHMHFVVGSLAVAGYLPAARSAPALSSVCWAPGPVLAPGRSVRDPASPAGTRARGVGPAQDSAPSQAGYLSTCLRR